MSGRFTAARSVPLATQVAEHLRMRIANGEWPVGSRIPGETQLAADFEVSRGTVREALRALTSAGLLEPRVGDGTYVHATDELSALLTRQATGDSAAAHAMQVREIFESAAAVLAAQVADAGDITNMREALARRRAANDELRVEAYVDADAALHRAIIVASRNPILLRLYDAVGHVVADSILRSTSLPEDERLGQLHVDLVDAIERGHGDDAAGVARALNMEVRFLDSLDRDAP